MKAKSGVLRLKPLERGRVAILFHEFPREGQWVDATGKVVNEEAGIALMLAPRQAGDGLGRTGNFTLKPTFIVHARQWEARDVANIPRHQRGPLDPVLPTPTASEMDRIVINANATTSKIVIDWIVDSHTTLEEIGFMCIGT